MFRSRFARVVAAIVVCFFTWTLAGGATAAHAAKLSAEKAKHDTRDRREKRAEQRFEEVVGEIERVIADPATDHAGKKRRLKAQRTEIKALAKEVRRELKATERKLKTDNLPAEIIERHRQFVEHYEKNLAELEANLDALDRAKGGDAEKREFEKTRKHLKNTRVKKDRHTFDPDKLPHRSAEPTKIKPRLKKEEFERAYGKDAASLPRPIRVAALGDLSGLLPDAGTTLLDLGAPSIDDLAGTVDADLTPAIMDKAAELGHDPVKIYNWVRNNIEFVPTWGSIQGAQMTMETRQGNAMDTASLLIALLRASNIHARYVIGTVQLPIDKIMNWVGNFTDPNAALDFMSSGGIPTTSLVDGGTIKAARFEHVWVEAWIDYLPSRGARHQQGQGDTWIPLDPSYKQYTYTDGIDIAAAVPFDAQGFVDQLTASATINEAEGSVTGVDSLLVQQTMTDYQSRVEDYIAQQFPDATVGDVLGKKEVVVQDCPYLLGTLPYRTEVRGGAYAVLPSSLRHKLSFTVVRDSVDTTPLSYTASLPELAGKKITLSYSPATQADEDVIASYLPAPHEDGTPIQIEELPTSVPAYLVNVKPELRIEGTVVATGSPGALGSSQQFVMNFFSPWIQNDLVENSIKAGTFNAIGLDLGRISPKQISALEGRLEGTASKIGIGDYEGLTKGHIVGDMLYTTALLYLLEVNATRQLTSRVLKVASVTWPSESIFASEMEVDSLFGMPRSISFGGLVMDADRLASVNVALDGDNQQKVNFMLQVGMTSSTLEHLVPEVLFSSSDITAEGVSTAKVLQIANSQKIPILNIDKDNLSSVIPRLQVEQQVKELIVEAVSSGKIVTIPQKDINLDTWTGCGYVVIEPKTGAGAYMISGGLSGAQIFKKGMGSFLQYEFDRWDSSYYRSLDHFGVPINTSSIPKGRMDLYKKTVKVLDRVGLVLKIANVFFDENKSFSEKANEIAGIIAKDRVSKLLPISLTGFIYASGVAAAALSYFFIMKLLIEIRLSILSLISLDL